ncbi:MAG: LiaF transmembrane domain-containing protein [Anaerolineae bacterium]
MRKGTVLLGLILILVGTYSLLEVLYSRLPGLDRLWPVAVISGGITLLVAYFRTPQRETARVFWGVALILSGLLLFLITLTDQNYAVLQTWWPVFVAIAGISFLAMWIAEGFRDWGILFLAIVSLIFGGVYIAVNLHLFDPNTVREIGHLWPALLIIIGLILLLRSTLGGKRTGK